jgi:tetratricopeptide (TPR) repeat protein
MSVRLSKPAVMKLAAILCLGVGERSATLSEAAGSDLNRQRAGAGAPLATDGPAYLAFAGKIDLIVSDVIDPLLGDDEWPVEDAVMALDAALPSALVTEKDLGGLARGPDALAGLALLMLGRVDPRFLETSGHHEIYRETGFAIISSVLEQMGADKDAVRTLAREIAAEDVPPGAPGGARGTLEGMRDAITHARQRGDSAQLAALLLSYGSALAEVGKFSDAVEVQREAVWLFDQLVLRTPDSLALQRERFVAMMQLAQGLLTLGQIGEAEQPAQAGLAAIRAVVAVEPRDPRPAWDLASALDIAGDLAFARDENLDALAMYREALELRMRLAEAAPEDFALAIDISTTHDRIGRALMRDNQLKNAIVEFNNALAQRQQLSQRDRDNPRLMHDVARSCTLLGDALLRAGCVADALTVLRNGRDIYQHLVQQRPDDLGLRQDFAGCIDSIGDVQMMLGDYEGAMRSYRSGMAIILPLAASDTSHIGRQRNLALCHGRVARACEMTGNPDEAILGFQRGRGIIQRLIRPGSRDTQLAGDLDWFDANLRRLGRGMAGGLGSL